MRTVGASTSSSAPPGKNNYEWMKSGGIGNEKQLAREEIQREKDRLRQEENNAKETRRREKKKQKEEKMEEEDRKTRIPFAPTGMSA